MSRFLLLSNRMSMMDNPDIVFRSYTDTSSGPEPSGLYLLVVGSINNTQKLPGRRLDWS